MHTTIYLAAVAAVAVPAFAQTFTDCNPLEKTCPANPALGKSVQYDFTKGAPSDFTGAAGKQPIFNATGGVFSMQTPGDSPTLASNWYLMFGNVKVEMKPAPGQGVVSSIVLESKTLDEVDWEWIGNDLGTVQTNYFGKGDTTVWDRGANFPDVQSADGFNTYEIDWTSEHIQWIINGRTIRTLTPATAHVGQYPQTPMQLKLGNWAGGDSKNEGTVAWAGGKTQWQNAPFNMIVRRITATDYSTGTSYEYTDRTGSWQSIRANGGKVNDKGSVPNVVSTASASGSSLTASPTASAISQASGIPTTATTIRSVQGTGTVSSAFSTNPTSSFSTYSSSFSTSYSSSSFSGYWNSTYTTQGVATPTGVSDTGRNVTVGTTSSSIRPAASSSSTAVTGAGSVVKPAIAGLLAAGLFAVLAL